MQMSVISSRTLAFSLRSSALVIGLLLHALLLHATQADTANSAGRDDSASYITLHSTDPSKATSDAKTDLTTVLPAHESTEQLSQTNATSVTTTISTSVTTMSPLSTTKEPPSTTTNETANEISSTTSTSSLSIAITPPSSSTPPEIHDNSSSTEMSTTRNKTTTANITIISLTTQSYSTSKSTVLKLNTTVEAETTTPVNIPTTHQAHTNNTDTETQTSSQLSVSTQLSTTSTWVSPSSQKPSMSTRKSTTSQPTLPPPSTNSKYLWVNEIFLSEDIAKQYIEIKQSETSIKIVYTIMFFSNDGKPTVCDKTNGTKPYFVSNCTDVNLYKSLENNGSVAIAVYRTHGEISMLSKGLQDAVVLIFPGKSVSTQLKILKQHSTYVELKEKGDVSVSRCENSFVQLQTSLVSKRQKNTKCPQHGVHPTGNEHKKDNVKVTVAVVFSCLAVFIAIIVFSIVWMRRRNPGIRHLRLSSIGKDDDDDLILNMDTVDEFEGENDDPTFKNSTYNCLKLK